MTTQGNKSRASNFTPVELELLMMAYAEYEHAISKKGNTIVAAKEREQAWQKIADRVNACNPTGIKRTWQQIKMKYKNIVQTANRKKAEARKTGGGPPPTPLTEAEEMALSQNTGRPMADGILGGSSSDTAMPQDRSSYRRITDGVISVVELPDTHEMSNAENLQGEPTASTATAQPTSLPVKQLYKIYLEKQIDKSDLEMEHIKQKMQKTLIDIQILEHHLKEIKKSA
ncbi:uncharacterized protein LOC125725074 isoform X1 [Brienomyrus brachyistius]|uniref:uncharacterized protein LOC125715986 isoform X1 n=2 Tax=Brienomyrus brachyistius TaxID=42636 RepID=UPI0020B1FDE6|nr:uncharacterized protein LOC125715986 isoform X1 [Brienomyrus brachyistius]XP_048847617.1 uncharacterized protein LOC125718109 isoform X1 [Brienomyrus brachyistius]XP_048857650.1 uncharacterized protein LOC125725074 isoform X1 [Brienomyrus brachyistius]